MNTPATDYGEPWRPGHSGIRDRMDFTVKLNGAETNERIAVAVNACAGMADPEKEIREMREAKACQISLVNLLADIRAAVGDPHGKLMLSELVEHCKKMRSAITGAVECLAGLDQHLPGNLGMFLLQALDKLQPFVK